MKKILPHLLLAVLSSTLLSTMAAAAGGKLLIKCWYDDTGLRECGSTVPPEYSRNRIELLNEYGVVVEVREAVRTKEEQEREKERQQQEQARQTKLAEQKRRDDVLLNSYTAEKDLLLARDKTLEGVTTQMEIIKKNLELHQTRLDRLNHDAGNYERNGKTPPAKLVDDINAIRQEVANLQHSYKSREAEKASLIKRYNDDLKRFRELKRRNMFN